MTGKRKKKDMDLSDNIWKNIAIGLILLGLVAIIISQVKDDNSKLCVPQMAGIYTELKGNSTVIVLDRSDALQLQLANEIEKVWRQIVATKIPGGNK